MSNDATSGLPHAPAPGTSTATRDEIVDTLRGMVLSDDYPCVGAKSVFTRRTAQIDVYERWCDPESSDLYEGLSRYAESTADVDDDTFVSYLAVFRGPAPTSEQDFERQLWRQLEVLRGHDATHGHPWDDAVSPDPANPHFGVSFRGVAFFVIGMHPLASRLARRTPWPVLVFNLHRQFEALRASGRYPRMRETIRTRDVRLQGSVNPMMADHGSISEGRQYSGRAVPESWEPPVTAWPRTEGES
jgi:FPC/CPF motif-containing protein YcgG